MKRNSATTSDFSKKTGNSNDKQFLVVVADATWNVQGPPLISCLRHGSSFAFGSPTTVSFSDAFQRKKTSSPFQLLSLNVCHLCHFEKSRPEASGRPIDGPVSGEHPTSVDGVEGGSRIESSDRSRTANKLFLFLPLFSSVPSVRFCLRTPASSRL